VYTLPGPARGKLRLDASVHLADGEEVKLEGTFVCIHVKGYSFARVTHLDIEHELLDNLIPPKRGGLHEIRGFRGGIGIRLQREKEIEYRGKKLKPKRILVRCPLLNEILKNGQRTRTWVGGKFGGIYIGFRKPEVARMERLAERKFGISPP
jgi:hypothetical protein